MGGQGRGAHQMCRTYIIYTYIYIVHICAYINDFYINFLCTLVRLFHRITDSVFISVENCIFDSNINVFRSKYLGQRCIKYTRNVSRIQADGTKILISLSISQY